MVGEFGALLVTVTLPVTLPVEAGVKVAFSVAVCPEDRMVPVATPLALKPGPETLTFEIETPEPPALASVTGKLATASIVTLPKFSVDGLAFNWPGALTVKLAALLVALPVLLLTVTVNCVVVCGLISPQWLRQGLPR